MIRELNELATNAAFIGRTNVNAWEEPEIVAAVKAIGRIKVVMGGYWTGASLAYPTIIAQIRQPATPFGHLPML